MSNELRSVQQLEAEIAELEKRGQPVEVEEEEPEVEEEVEEPEITEVEKEEIEEPVSKEEETFKKRYSDLRRHSQKLADDLKELQAKLKSSTSVDAGLPTAEEAAEWVKANPKAAAIIRSIASNETSSNLDDVQAIKEKLNRAEQEAKINKAHPDFEQITSENEFHDWADEQPESVQRLIFSNDAADVIWAVSQYKKDTTKAPSAKKEAAKAVSSKASSVEPADQSKGRFTESQISKMSMSEYEKNEAAIQEAISSGKFVYDLSGGAR